jgi:hypothetical protein
MKYLCNKVVELYMYMLEILALNRWQCYLTAFVYPKGMQLEIISSHKVARPASWIFL